MHIHEHLVCNNPGNGEWGGGGGQNHANLFTFSRHMRFVFSMYELNQKQFLFTSNISTKETKSAGFI